MHIVTATAQSLGQDACILIVNRSTLRRRRMHHRGCKATETFLGFTPKPDLIAR